MASMIVDEGDGAQEHPLSNDRTVVGSNPACDIRLHHVTATGSRFIVDRSAKACRISVLKGEVLLNDRSVVTAQLRHNDTLRVGEATLLYQDPPAGGAARPSSPAMTKASQTLRDLRRLLESISEPPLPPPPSQRPSP
jgi:ferric-dicitrate binding protein FerR (iron transport regulator)